MVNVFFAQSSYTVFESDPSVELCLQVDGSALDRAVTVVVMTNETGSAQGNVSCCSLCLSCHVLSVPTMQLEKTSLLLYSR